MEYLFAVGFISILGQVVLLRELSVAFFGVELIYTLSLGIWLFSNSCGVLFRRHSPAPSVSRINLLFLLLALGFPLEIAFVRSVRLLFSGVPGGYFPLQTQILILLVSLLPIGLLLGLLFQWAAKAYVSNQKTLAHAYAIESMGGLAGGIGATLFFKFGFQNFQVGLLCGLAAIGSSFLYSGAKACRWFRPVSLAVSGLLVLLVWKAPVLDRSMTAWTHPNLVESKDSPYSRVTVTFREGQVSVFENDALLFDTESSQAEEFVQLAMLQHAAPQRVLVLGGGIEGIVYQVLQHSPKVVDYVELNPALLEIVPRHLPLELQQSLKASPVRITTGDPRQFTDTALTYDVILVGMAEPASGQANRFYTQEFFRQCRRILSDHGLIAFRLQSSENFWTPQVTLRMLSICRAAKSVFPEVMVIPGNLNVIVGSSGPLTRNAEELTKRVAARQLKLRLVSSAYLQYAFTNERFSEIGKIVESGTAPINTDINPVCYQYTTMIWLSKFLPSLKSWTLSLPEPRNRILWVLGFSIPFLALGYFRWPVRRAVLAGVAGFSGMVLEIVLILHYQIKHGILYQDFGILVTSFMAGLALGSMVAARHHKRHGKWMGFAFVFGFVVLSALTAAALESGRNAGLPGTLVLLFLAGFFVAGIFGYSSLHQAEDQKTVITPLYSMDLLGGCIGSVLASLVLVPMAGLEITVLVLIPLAMFSALLL
jgi:spermidine synthase